MHTVRHICVYQKETILLDKDFVLIRQERLGLGREDIDKLVS